MIFASIIPRDRSQRAGSVDQLRLRACQALWGRLRRP